MVIINISSFIYKLSLSLIVCLSVRMSLRPSASLRVSVRLRDVCVIVVRETDGIMELRSTNGHRSRVRHSLFIRGRREGGRGRDGGGRGRGVGGRGRGVGGRGTGVGGRGRGVGGRGRGDEGEERGNKSGRGGD